MDSHWFLVMLLIGGGAVNARPVEETPYGRACLRLEARGWPWLDKGPEALWEAERAADQAGVDARWIQVVDHWGTPLVRNGFLPCPFPEADENEARLKEWVQQIHEAGLPALSWYPLIFCQQAWQEHPDWRQVSIQGWPPGQAKDISCCINSPYGDALTGYCLEAIGKFGLDGIWFDGSVWSPIWERPLPLTCRCQYCQERFRRETGLELPDHVDWSDAAFRRWIRWRYETFGAYIGKLAGAIREQYPDCAVVINHYHRPGIPWHSAVPLDKYAADIISGSEAFSPETLDLTVRLCRAYGRSEAEVWRPFRDDGGPAEACAEVVAGHALTAYCAGGYPAFGTDIMDPRVPPTAALVKPVMAAIHPYVGGTPLPGVALHVSQQTETFHFGRATYNNSTIDPYFSELGTWTTALGEAHLPPDYLFDADLTPERVARYPVLLLPISLALTDAQCATVTDYARQGGCLVLGMGAGRLDAEGEPRADDPLGAALGYHFAGVPRPDGSDAVTLSLDGDHKLRVSGRYAPLTLRDEAWQVLYRHDDAPVVAERAFGQGQVLVLAIDTLRAWGSTPSFGGLTDMRVTDETAASGRYSLKYVDHPQAPQPFYPDLENRLMAFGTPDYAGGELSCDLRVDQAAVVNVEIRSSEEPIAGPIVAVHNGRVLLGGTPLCEVPLDQWFHLSIDYDFAAGDQPAKFETTVTLPDGTVQRGSAAPPRQDYHRTDWFVIYGAGQAEATFYLDNLRLMRRHGDGAKESVLDLDFEDGTDSLTTPSGLLDQVADWITTRRPPAIAVDAPPTVRVGVFEQPDGRVLVHLHHRVGTLADWLQAVGPAVTIRCAAPVKRARSLLTGQELPAGGGRVEVPHVGLYELIELSR